MSRYLQFPGTQKWCFYLVTELEHSVVYMALELTYELWSGLKYKTGHNVHYMHNVTLASTPITENHGRSMSGLFQASKNAA